VESDDLTFPKWKWILTKTGRGLIAAPYEQRRDHFHRSPPPRSRGMGGHLRLRYQPLPPDPVRGFSFIKSAV
jgi:hypothetical protein